MVVTLDELDGIYEVRSANMVKGRKNEVDGDGTTEIRNGLTFRKDRNGMIWESSFSVIDEGRKVEMESTVDPSHAGHKTFLHDSEGQLTKGILRFKTVLDVSEERGSLVLSGVIEFGEEKTLLVMRKIQSLQDL